VQLRDERAKHSRIKFVITAKDVSFLSAGPTYGFVEVGVGGTDAGGNPVACTSNFPTCVGSGSTQSCRLP